MYPTLTTGFLFLVAIMDWATRKVLAWRLSNTLDASFCVDALDEAIAKYGKPEIMNTDQRSQFTGSAWITTLTEAEVKISMPLGVCLQTPAGNRWAGAISGQHLHRTAVAVIEARGRLPARTTRWFPSQTGDQRLDQLLQL